MSKRIYIYTIVSVFLAFLILSCSESIEETSYLDDPNQLHIEVAGTQESGITRTYVRGFQTRFFYPDKIGVYAFDKNNRCVYKNIEYSLDITSTVWEPSENIIFDSTYTYYAYYPYKDEPYEVLETSGDKDVKFSNFISDSENIFWKADQSTDTNHMASDLMTSEGTIGNHKTVRFVMSHKMGMARIDENTENSANLTYSNEKTSSSYYCKPVFEGNKPFLNTRMFLGNASAFNEYQFFVKQNTNTLLDGYVFNIKQGEVEWEKISLTGNPQLSYSISDDGSNFGVPTTTSPSWLQVTPVYEEGKPTNFNIAVSSYLTANKPIDSKLRWASVISNCDLSMTNNDGSKRNSRTTANCYLVHASGSYSIPLVYGNAIKNGKGNPTAYYDAQNSQGLVNHKNELIYTGNDDKDPWIKNHGINVDGAKLVWQDTKGLIQSVNIDGDYLKFSVRRDSITEGNALLAATSGGQIVWSWHIWVTNETLDKSKLTTITTSTNTYKVSSVNLGYGATQNARQCNIYAESQGVKIMIPVVPLSYQNNYINTYYQWGRKDPFPSSLLPIYDIKNNIISLKINDIDQIGNTISNPDELVSGDATNINKLINWNMNTMSKSQTIKTIYDPCPPDYCVPPANLLSYFANGISPVWIKQEYHNGISLNTSNGNIFLPAAGRIKDGSETASDCGSHGFYWSSGYPNNKMIPSLDLTTDGCHFSSSYMQEAKSVRPILEDE